MMPIRPDPNPQHCFILLNTNLATWNIVKIGEDWGPTTVILFFARIRIQHFRLNTDPDPDPVFFYDQKFKKIYSWNFFSSKTTIYLSLGLHEGRPSYKRRLQLSKENIQHFKTWNFLFFFQLLWVNFALLDPDPQTWLYPDPKPFFLPY